jgi:hypothetical protein
MVPDLYPVQLHDELPVDDQLLIFIAAVAAARSHDLLIPPA